jgi:fructokinase
MFLCCGDSLFDMFSGPSADPHGVALDGHVGGSPLNVALGLARMGNHSRFFTRVSTDMFGRRISAFMAANGIDSSLCVPTRQNTTLAMIGLKEDNSADYVFYTDGTADCSMVRRRPAGRARRGDPRRAFRLLFDGDRADGGDAGLLAAREARTPLRLLRSQPAHHDRTGHRHLARYRVAAMTRAASFMKASDEDIAQLGTTPEKFAADAIASGTDLVCVTLGNDGAFAFSADGRETRLPGIKVDVADTVGAGDTFQAACLHWLGAQGLTRKGKAREADLDAMAGFAIKAAAVTCTRRGADLPTLADIEAFGV